MLTKYGSYNIMKNMVCRQQSDSSINYLDIDGNSVGSVGYATFVWNAFQTGTTAGMKLMVGTGDTPPTYDDYCLENREIGGVDIDTLISTANGSVTVDGLGQYSITATFTNLSQQTIDINEIGLVAISSNSTYRVLMARSVIPKKTLEPSDSVTLTYTISPLTI